MALRRFNRAGDIAAITFALFGSISWTAGDELLDVEFRTPVASNSDVVRTLQSVVKVQGIDGLYLATHSGDHESLFQEENRKLIEEPVISDRSRHCSVFSVGAAGSVLMGRNWDNENVGSIIISHYSPKDAYSSVSFSRSIELGFGRGLRLDTIQSVELGKRLMLAPFYAVDGINEHGLAVAVAGDAESAVGPVKGRTPVFISYLIRKMLDQAKTTEEAVALANDYVPFLLDENTLVAHLMIVDATGRSTILEYVDDQWRPKNGVGGWQALSTKRVYGVPDDDLRKNCWRYRGMSEALEARAGAIDWRGSMEILRAVEQKGTTWSIVYSPSTLDVYFSVYRQWNRIYHLRPFSRQVPGS